MAPWLVFGTGKNSVDARTLELALAEHRPMIAVVHNPQVAAGLQEKGMQIFVGDVCDSQVTAYACRAVDQHTTMTSSMDGARDYLAYRTVIDEAEKTEIGHMILVTSLGYGDSQPFLSPRARAAFGQTVREKSLAESWLQASLLGYAILRPDGLLNGKTTDPAQRMQVEECHDLVMYADVAWHIHKLATAPALNGQIYSLVEPGLKPA